AQRGTSVTAPGPVPVCNSLLQSLHIEVDAQANFPSAESQIRQQLRLVDRLEALNGLDLNNDCARHENVDAVPTCELEPLVLQWKRELTLEGYVPQRQFPAEAFLICRLQQAGPQSTMDFDRCPDDLLGEVIDSDAHFSASSAPLR